MLARDVWKEPRRATPLDNVIDVQMTRLRKKVDVEGTAPFDPYRSRCRVRVAGRRAIRGGWSSASIRVRLTAWYTAVLSLMLVMYATATFVAVRHEFREQLEEQRQKDLETQTGRTRSGPGKAAPGTTSRSAGGPRARSSADRRTRWRWRVRPGAAGAGPNRPPGGGSEAHHRRSPPPAAIGAQRAGRNRTAGRGDQRHARSTGFVVRSASALYRGCVARIEDASGGHAQHRGNRRPRDADAGGYKDTIGSMFEEVDRLTRLVDTLLRLSRGDAGTVRLSRDPRSRRSHA